LNFQELYKTYNKQVYNLALHYVQNIEDAQEITQDVFVSIHQSIDSFQKKSTLSTWIYRITINKCLDFIKSKSRRNRVSFLTSLFTKDTKEVRFDHPNFDHPGVLMEQKEALTKIFECINSLRTNQKTAIILSKIEKKNQQEISEIMGLSIKAVESLIQRAKQNLTDKLELNEGK